MLVDIYQINHQKFITAISSYLKNNSQLEIPKDYIFKKTCSGKENCPLDSEWYYSRTASILRRTMVYMVQNDNKGITTARLASVYGCSKNRGFRPSKHVPATKSIIKKGFRDLESIGWIKKEEKGRILTEKAINDLSEILEIK